MCWVHEERLQRLRRQHLHIGLGDQPIAHDAECLADDAHAPHQCATQDATRGNGLRGQLKPARQSGSVAASLGGQERRVVSPHGHQPRPLLRRDSRQELSTRNAAQGCARLCRLHGGNDAQRRFGKCVQLQQLIRPELGKERHGHQCLLSVGKLDLVQQRFRCGGSGALVANGLDAPLNLLLKGCNALRAANVAWKLQHQGIRLVHGFESVHLNLGLPVVLPVVHLVKCVHKKASRALCLPMAMPDNRCGHCGARGPRSSRHCVVKRRELAHGSLVNLHVHVV